MLTWPSSLAAFVVVMAARSIPPVVLPGVIAPKSTEKVPDPAADKPTMAVNSSAKAAGKLVGSIHHS